MLEKGPSAREDGERESWMMIMSSAARLGDTYVSPCSPESTNATPTTVIQEAEVQIRGRLSLDPSGEGMSQRSTDH